jgi:hypothetical protein
MRFFIGEHSVGQPFKNVIYYDSAGKMYKVTLHSASGDIETEGSRK